MRQATFSKERLPVTLRFLATGKKVSSATFAIVKVVLRYNFLFYNIAEVAYGLMSLKFVVN